MEWNRRGELPSQTGRGTRRRRGRELELEVEVVMASMSSSRNEGISTRWHYGGRVEGWKGDGFYD